MQKITLMIAAILSFSALAEAAEAACKMPYGKYIGSGAGEIYYSGGLADVGASMTAITVSSNGSWKGDAWAKGVTVPFETRTYTVPAVGTAKHSFDINTCRGSFVDSENIQYMYIVYNNGNSIQTFPIIKDVSRTFVITYYRP